MEKNVAQLKPVGIVNMKIVKKDGTTTIQKITNNVLNVGRLALLRMLANTSGSGSVYFERCIVSDQGATQSEGGGYVEKQVSRDRDGLYGTTLDQIAVVSTVSRDSNNNPYAVVSSVLGYESSSNGHMVNEVGLQLANGDLYAMVTWPGTYKDADTQIVIEWMVYFL